MMQFNDKLIQKIEMWDDHVFFVEQMFIQKFIDWE